MGFEALAEKAVPSLIPNSGQRRGIISRVASGSSRENELLLFIRSHPQEREGQLLWVHVTFDLEV